MDRIHEVEQLVVGRLRELAGEASLCWDPAPSTEVFNATAAAAAAERAATDVAKLLVGAQPELLQAYRRSALQGARDSRGLRAEIARLAQVILEEFDGPGPGVDGCGESAIDAAIRIMRGSRPPEPEHVIRIAADLPVVTEDQLAATAGLNLEHWLEREIRRHREFGLAALELELGIRRVDESAPDRHTAAKAARRAADERVRLLGSGYGGPPPSALEEALTTEAKAAFNALLRDAGDAYRNAAAMVRSAVSRGELLVPAESMCLCARSHGGVPAPSNTFHSRTCCDVRGDALDGIAAATVSTPAPTTPTCGAIIPGVPGPNGHPDAICPNPVPCPTHYVPPVPYATSPRATVPGTVCRWCHTAPCRCPQPSSSPPPSPSRPKASAPDFSGWQDDFDNLPDAD